MSKKVVLKINFCDDCPHFDNHYPNYAQRCGLLGGKINHDKEFNYVIPDECPLNEFDDEADVEM